MRLFPSAFAIATATATQVCVTTKETNVCVDGVTGDLAQLNGLAMLPGSGTTLQDCAPITNRTSTTIEHLAGGGLRVARTLACVPNAYHDTPAVAIAVVVDTYTPAADGTIAWNVSVAGRADAASRWSTGVQTALGYRDWDTEQGAAAWVGGPHVAALPNATFDPLAPFAVDRPAASYGDFMYGSPHSNILTPGKRAPSDDGKATHLPVLVRIDSANATAVVQALDYVPIVSITNVGVADESSANGGGVWLNYTRLYERLGGATPTLAFTQHVLAVAADDWRPAVAFLNARHPDMFEPNADANALDWEGECSYVYRYILRESCSQIDSLPLTYLTFACIALDWEGPGSYADLRGPIDFPAADAPHYAAMGYRLNWDSTARFPWHGDWVPTDADGFNGHNWTSCFAHDAPDGHLNEPCSTFSYAEISGWYAHQRALGFRTCNYANLFQFGWSTKAVWNTNATGSGAPNARVNCSAAATSGSSQAQQEQALACHTQRLLAAPGGYAPALLVHASAPGAEESPSLSCMGMEGSCGMDPHPDLPYLAHLLDMARTGIARTNSSGVCIDRQDWIQFVNPRADDGRTWFPYFAVPASPDVPRFGPVRAMIFSWHLAMAALADVMHPEGKAIIINDHVNRIDMMRNVDGIYAEMGDLDPVGFGHVIGSGLAAMHKPVVSWIHTRGFGKVLPHLEQSLQGLLYVGAYPTVPVKNNDHAIGGDCAPNCTYDALFKDYGPLFTALRGKRWVLAAHAAQFQEASPLGSGRVNVFEKKKR